MFQASSGLSLFYLETKTSDGKYNNLELIRLKDKLGTRQLPTAELLLDGTCAHLVSVSLLNKISVLQPESASTVYLFPFLYPPPFSSSLPPLSLPLLPPSLPSPLNKGG